MGLGFVTLTLTALLCQQAAASLIQRPSAVSSSPAFVWGSLPVLSSDNEHAARVIYEDVNSMKLADSLWETLSSPQVSSASQSKPDALLVYVGHKLRLEAVSEGDRVTALDSLHKSIKSARSSISIPSLVHEEAQDLKTSLIDHFQSKAASLETLGSCSSASGESQSADEAVRRLSSGKAAGPKVLIVCGDAADTLADELSNVSQFSKALQDAFSSHLMAYVSDTSQANGAGAASRSLLQTLELPAEVSGLQLPSYAALTANQAGYLCDAKCFTQVRVIEVFILFVTLLTALLSGICMMNVLGTPTKFETAKDARQES